MADKKTEVEPTLIVVGTGNKNGVSLMQQGVVADPLPNKVGGMNVIKVDGINGKGEHKEYGANPMTKEADLVAASSQIAKAVVVAKNSVDAKRYVFKDPANDGATLHAIFDARNPEAPLAIFRKSVQGEGEDAKLVTEKLNDKEIVIVPKGNYTKDDLGKVLTGLVSVLNSKAIDTDSLKRIVGALKEANLLAPSKTSQIFDFVAVFDQHMAKTEENIKALKMALVVEQDLNIPTAGLEKLSEVYNPMTMNGISIASMQNASDVTRLINGEVENEEGLSAGEKAFLAYAQANELTAMELIEAETVFGVDANGHIVVIEDSNVPYLSGGAIHETELKNKIADALSAKKVIDAAFWDKANEIDPDKYPRKEDAKKYTDAEIAQAEKTLQAEAEKYVKQLGEVAETKLQDVLANQDPIVTMLTSGDLDKMQKAQNNARDLMAVVRAGATKQAFRDNPLALVRDGYFKDGRQLGQANSSPKKPVHADYKKGEKIIKVLADIPKLIKTIGDNAVVNLKTTKMPVFEVLVDKEGKALDVAPVNTFGAWSKQQKLGRVLKSIMDLRSDDEKLETKFKSLMNFGSKRDGESTEFGLGAIVKDEESQIGQFFKETISQLRATTYPDGKEKFDAESLAEVQEQIRDMVNSEDYSIQNLGKQVIALQKRADNLEDYFTRAGVSVLRSRSEEKKEKREHLKDVMLRVLNNIEVEPTKGATLSIAKTAEVVKAYIDPVRKSVNEVALKVATDMGFKHDDFKRGNIIQATKDGKNYIRSGYYNENIVPAKADNIETIIGKAKASSANIDLEAVKTRMEALQTYYNENKEVFVRKSSLYTEDESVETGVGVQLDEDLAKALSELTPETEAPATAQPDEIDAAAEMEESGEVSHEEVVDMTQVSIDPKLFGDEIDVEEDLGAGNDESKAVESAKAVQVEL